MRARFSGRRVACRFSVCLAVACALLGAGGVTPSRSEPFLVAQAGDVLGLRIEGGQESAGRAGETVSFALTVVNEGLNALAGIVVSGGSRPPVCESSGGSRVALLPPGGRERCAGVHVVSQGDLDRAAERDGRLDLVFSARSGEANTQALVPIRLDIRPGLSLERSHSFVADGGTRDAADRDDTIAHVYVVTNSGNVTIEDVFISDRQSGTGRRTPVASETMIHDALPLGDSSDRNGNDGRWSRLAPGDSVLFAATYTVTQADLDRQVREFMHERDNGR